MIRCAWWVENTKSLWNTDSGHTGKTGRSNGHKVANWQKLSSGTVYDKSLLAGEETDDTSAKPISFFDLKLQSCHETTERTLGKSLIEMVIRIVHHCFVWHSQLLGQSCHCNLFPPSMQRPWQVVLLTLSMKPAKDHWRLKLFLGVWYWLLKFPSPVLKMLDQELRKATAQYLTMKNKRDEVKILQIGFSERTD